MSDELLDTEREVLHSLMDTAAVLDDPEFTSPALATWQWTSRRRNFPVPALMKDGRWAKGWNWDG